MLGNLGICLVAITASMVLCRLGVGQEETLVGSRSRRVIVKGFCLGGFGGKCSKYM